ncbi:hypothetical protein UT300019_23550 [Clostridium sp. CTA-19]
MPFKIIKYFKRHFILKGKFNIKNINRLQSLIAKNNKLLIKIDFLGIFKGDNIKYMEGLQ